MEPYWATLQGATEVGDTFSRFPMLAPNPPEDAFTGSATGCLAAYLWSRGLIDDYNFIAEQGHFMVPIKYNIRAKHILGRNVPLNELTFQKI